MSVKGTNVALAKGIYIPKNDPTTPWLAGILEMPATNSIKAYTIPVFYVGNNNNTFFGAYSKSESWFSHALKDLILQLHNGKKEDCVKLDTICLNGFPLFIRQNKSGDEYLSTNDDVISLVAKRNGAKDGDYTIKNLTVDARDKKIRVIPMIHDVLVEQPRGVSVYKPIISITAKIKEKMETFKLEYPYYQGFHTQYGYLQLQQMLQKSCHNLDNDLCDTFNRRRENLYKEQLAPENLAVRRLETEAHLIKGYSNYKKQHNNLPVFLGGTRHKKKTKRAKRSKRTKHTRRH